MTLSVAFIKSGALKTSWRNGLVEGIRLQVATDPPSSRGGGRIWSDSRIALGEILIDSIKLPKFGGRALAKPQP